MKKLLTFAFAAALAFAGTASATTVEELQAMIAELTAQLAAVSTTTTTTTGSYTFNNDLTMESTGADVIALQDFLIGKGTLVIPAGVSKGYFGNLTRSALASYQTMVGIAPAAGYFGPVTRAHVNGLMTTVVTTTDTDDLDTDDSGMVSGDEEADIDELTFDEGDDDDLSNNTRGQEAFTFEIETDERGGDLTIDRIDLTFDTVTGNPGENDPWDIIEAISIELDGDEITSEDTDDKDDWNGDEVTYRLSGLNTVVKAGDKLEYSIMLDIADLDEDDDLDLTIDLDAIEIRYTDETGYTNEYGDDTAGSATAVVEAKDAFELDIDESDDNEDDSTISLATDEDDVLLLVADVDVDGQDGTLEDVDVTVVINAADAAVGIETDDLLSKLSFFVDGDEIDTDDAEGVLDASGDATVVFSFDLEDMEVEDEDSFEIEVRANLEELADASALAGATIQVTLVQFDGEDSEGDDVVLANVDYDSSSDAPVITVSAGALVLEDSDINGYNEIGDDTTAAKVKFTVDVKADGDEDITLDGLTGVTTEEGDVYNAFVFEIAGSEYFANSDGTLVSRAVGVDTVANTADDVETVLAGYTVDIEDSSNDDLLAGDNDEINDGSTETYVITIIVDATTTVAGTGEYEIELTEINWTEDVGVSDTQGTLDVSLTSDEVDLLDA